MHSPLPIRFLLGGGLFAAACLMLAGSRADQPKSIPILDRVPADAQLFLQVRVGEVLKSPIGKEIVSGLGKQVEPLLKQFQEQLGFSLLDIDRITVWEKSLANDDGEQPCAVFELSKPVDAAAIRKIWGNPAAKNDPKAEPKDDAIIGSGSTVVHLTDAKTVAILRKSQLKAYLEPKEAKTKTQEAALKLARENHALVVGIDFRGLPAEVLDDNNLFLRPFFPLMKDNRGLLVVDVEKDIAGRIQLDCKSADSATDAMRSWNLLMQLASDGIDFVTSDPKAQKEVGFANAYFKELQATIKGQKVKTEGSTLNVSATIKGDLAYSKLAAEIIKMVYGVSEASQDAVSTNNLKQLALALHNYASTHGGFPPQAICDKKGKPLLSWRVAILPYIEQNAVYQQFKLDEPWDSEHNLKLAEIRVKTFMHPADKQEKHTLTPYRVFFNNGAGFDRVKMTKIQDFQDGTSNTLLIVEAAESVVWTKPDDLEFNPKKDMKPLLRVSRDRLTVAFADGSVRRIANKLPESTLKLLIQKNDGMVIPEIE